MYVHPLHNSLRTTVDRCDVARQAATIDVLPDVALLEVFDYYMDVNQTWRGEQKWHTLVHVCRKWRYIVFGSPLRLDLRLFCDALTPVRETLDVWPLLPIVVWDQDHGTKALDDGVIAALEHNDRICQLHFYAFSGPRYEKVLEVMRQPFSALTHLDLEYIYLCPPPVIPASFLGGSAPALKSLRLYRIPFPALPKLLLSATHLVHLKLLNIPHSAYISSETMVTCLSTLIRLELLYIGFKSPQSRPDPKTRRPPLLTRTPLPVLTELRFSGVPEYLEDLVARIDAPQLGVLAINFFHQLIFDTPQLMQFISRTPKLKTHDEARLVFSDDWGVSVALPQTYDGMLKVGVSCKKSDWQLSSLAQLCSSCFPPALIHAVQHLYILDAYFELDWQDDIESSQWMEVLHPFTAAEALFLSQELSPHIASILQELARERVSETLPALQNLFLEGTVSSGPVQEGIGQFVTARQRSSHPVVFSRWERKGNKWDWIHIFDSCDN
jgi:hypothetical protein